MTAIAQPVSRAVLDQSPSRVNLWILALGLGGVGALLLQAILRLAPLAIEAAHTGLSTFQWGVLAGWCVVSAYAEGHRGFHLRFAPRVVGRAFHLARRPFSWHTLVAPAYCMSLIHASRASRLRSWILLVGIVGLVMLVRTFPQPWRGIVDAGVVLGLGWGLASIGVHTLRALKHGATTPADLPD